MILGNKTVYTNGFQWYMLMCIMITVFSSLSKSFSQYTYNNIEILEVFPTCDLEVNWLNMNGYPCLLLKTLWVSPERKIRIEEFPLYLKLSWPLMLLYLLRQILPSFSEGQHILAKEEKKAKKNKRIKSEVSWQPQKTPPALNFQKH